MTEFEKIFKEVIEVKEPSYGYILNHSFDSLQYDPDFTLLDSKVSLKFQVLQSALHWTIELLAEKLSQKL